MTTMLVLNIPPELEEDLIDYLLSLPAVGGFTSYLTSGHGSDAQLSIAEQVTGRRRRMQFELLLDEAAVDALLAGLAGAVGRDIRYWQQPVSHMGQVD